MAKEGYVDLHLHSNGSLDGVHTIYRLIEEAKANGVDTLAITDHNSLDTIRQFYIENGLDLKNPIVEFNGVKIIPGVEITCRVGEVHNLSDNPTKIHLLVYGMDMSPDSPISRLLEVKAKNDKDCDMGVLRQLLMDNGYTEMDAEQLIRNYIIERKKKTPGYSTVGIKDIGDFLEKNEINIASSQKELNEMIECLPRYSRMTIWAKDAIYAAIRSGGLTSMAHPSVNVNRTNNRIGLIANLLYAGVDGFELFCDSATDGINQMIKRMSESEWHHKIFYTGGSDTHDFANGNNIGFAQGKPITKRRLTAFLKEIELLAEARKQGKLSHREYPLLESRDIDEVINVYINQYAEIVRNSKIDYVTYPQKPKPKKLTQKEAEKARKRQLRLMAEENNPKMNKGSASDFLSEDSEKTNE